jgi:hypothetical protein
MARGGPLSVRTDLRTLLASATAPGTPHAHGAGDTWEAAEHGVAAHLWAEAGLIYTAIPEVANTSIRAALLHTFRPGPAAYTSSNEIHTESAPHHSVSEKDVVGRYGDLLHSSGSWVRALHALRRNGHAERFLPTFVGRFERLSSPFRLEAPPGACSPWHPAEPPVEDRLASAVPAR